MFSKSTEEAIHSLFNVHFIRLAWVGTVNRAGLVKSIANGSLAKILPLDSLATTNRSKEHRLQWGTILECIPLQARHPVCRRLSTVTGQPKPPIAGADAPCICTPITRWMAVGSPRNSSTL
ncbi:hypothetical protein Ahia01_000564500 [Argonauta hians]